MNIDELKKLAEAATPGPWDVSVELNGDGYRCLEIFSTVQYRNWGDDARFIAAAREAVPELIAKVEKLEGAVSKTELYDRWLKSKDRVAELEAKLAIHEGGLQSDALKALNEQPLLQSRITMLEGDAKHQRERFEEKVARVAELEAELSEMVSHKDGVIFQRDALRKRLAEYEVMVVK